MRSASQVAFSSPLKTANRPSLLTKRFIYGPGISKSPVEDQRAAFTVLDFARRKESSRPIVMVTAYDASSAQCVERASIDIALVGDSAANVVHGHADTNRISMDQMVSHVESVAKQCSKTYVLGDLPFASYQVSPELAVANSCRLIMAGAQAVKLEGGRRMVDQIKAIRNAGISGNFNQFLNLALTT